MSKIILTENEESFFNTLKEFLFKAKEKFNDFDIVSFYQSLLEHKDSLSIQDIIELHNTIATLKYEPDCSEIPCCDTLYITTNDLITYKIEFSYYGEYRLQINKTENTFESFIELDESLTDELNEIFKDELKIHKQKKVKEELDKLRAERDNLQTRIESLEKEIA